MKEHLDSTFHQVNDERPLYIVALPEGAAVDQAVNCQRQLVQSFPIYTREPLPPLHVTLATLAPPGPLLPEVIRRLEALCRRLRPAPFRTTGIGCFGVPSLAVTVYIEKTKELDELTQEVHDAVATLGLLQPSPVKNWAYHMTLLSAITADEPWDEPTFAKACYHEAAHSYPMDGRLTAIALWLPEFRPLGEIARFTLLS